MRLLIVFTTVATATTAARYQFESWIKEHKKAYSSDAERETRFVNFQKTLEKIDRINNDPTKTWSAGLNKFSDMSWEEFRASYLMSAGQNCSATNVDGPRFIKNVKGPMPHEFDWRKMDAVSPVKDQGQCGSCWTFSTTGNIEAAARIHLRKKPIVSEQQLVDCAGAFNNNGCNGGLPSQAFEYIRSAPGIMSEADYPYTAKDGNCVFDASKAVVDVIQSVNLTALDENEMAHALVGYQPISIAFEVVDDFMHYKDGVYTSTTCKNGPSDVNHAVLAVGFGMQEKDGKLAYWDVKNSWGDSWGHKGYFKIERGTNMCGLAQCTSFALVQPQA